MLEIHFPDIAGYLADVLAKRFPEFSVGLEWPSQRVESQRWMFIRSDGVIKDSVATGDFSGAVTVKGLTAKESRETALAALSEIIRLQYLLDSPVTVLHRQVEPYLLHDETHGVMAAFPLHLGIMGEELQIQH